MDLNYKTVNIFPVPIHQIDVNGFDQIQNELIDYIYKIREKEPVGNVFSNRGGWQSKSFNISSEADPLHKFLIDSIGGLHVIKKEVNFVIDAWVNINGHNSYNVKHDHPTANLSGVLWIKCPKECGNIVFESPVEFQTYTEIKSYTEEFKNSNNYFHTYYFLPTEGRILLFPSHLQHEVFENKSNEDRISVSFNIYLING